MASGFEPVGVSTEVAGLDDFVQSMATMDQAVAGTGKTITDVSGKISSDFKSTGDDISGALTESQEQVLGLGETFGKSAESLDAFNKQGMATPSALQPATDGVKDLNGAFGQVSQVLSGGLMGGLSALAGAAGIGAVVSAVQTANSTMMDFINVAAEWGGMIDGLAYQTGASTEDLSRFAVALQAVGVDTSALTPAFRTFNNGMYGIQQAVAQGTAPTGAFAEALAKIGVSAFDSEGNLRTFTDMFPEIADGLNNLPAGAERSATAMDIFGRSAVSLGELLEKGSTGIATLTERADRLGLVMSESGAARAEQYEQSVMKLDQSFGALKMTIGENMIPVQLALNEATDKAIQGTGSWLDVAALLLPMSGAVAQKKAEEAAAIALSSSFMQESARGMNEAATASANAAVQAGFWAGQTDSLSNMINNGMNPALANAILYSEEFDGVAPQSFDDAKTEADYFKLSVGEGSTAVTQLSLDVLQMSADAIVGVGVVTENIDRLIEQITKTGEVSAGSLLSSTNGILTEAGKIAEMGTSFPKEDLENFIGQVGRLREVITMSDLTQAQQDALLNMLDAAQTKATEAAGVVQTTAENAGKAVKAAGDTGAEGWQNTKKAADDAKLAMEDAGVASTPAGSTAQSAGQAAAMGWNEAKAAADETKTAMDNLTSQTYDIKITWTKPPPEWIPESPKTHMQHVLENLFVWAQTHPIDIQWDKGTGGIGGILQTANETQDTLENLVSEPYRVTVIWDSDTPPEFIPQSPKTAIQYALENLCDWAQTHTIGIQMDLVGDGSIGDMLKFGGSASGLAGFFGGLFKKQQIDPLADRAEDLTARIEELNAALAAGKLDAGQYQWVMSELALTEEERAQVLAEMAAKQEEYNQMQAAQQQLEFLDQQMKLLDLISQYGLNPADIIGGLELGANADPAAIMAALTAAMQAIIAQTEGNLRGTGIEPPPPGWGGGIEGGMAAPLMPAGGGRGVNVTVGPNYINNDMDEAMFAARVETIVADAIGVGV